MGCALDEEAELARTDGRSWYDIAGSKLPLGKVLAFRDDRGRIAIAMNCIPERMTQWAFLR
jgi:hypothetical protein